MRGQPLMADPTADNATASTGKSPVMVETGLEGTLGPAATIKSRQGSPENDPDNEGSISSHRSTTSDRDAVRAVRETVIAFARGHATQEDLEATVRHLDNLERNMNSPSSRSSSRQSKGKRRAEGERPSELPTPGPSIAPVRRGVVPSQATPMVRPTATSTPRRIVPHPSQDPQFELHTSRSELDRGQRNLASITSEDEEAHEVVDTQLAHAMAAAEGQGARQMTPSQRMEFVAKTYEGIAHAAAQSMLRLRHEALDTATAELAAGYAAGRPAEELDEAIRVARESRSKLNRVNREMEGGVFPGIRVA